MRLYPRKINNIKELKREKRMLLHAHKQGAAEKKASGKEKKPQQGKEPQALDYLSLAGRLLQPGTMLEKAVAIAIPLFEFTPLGPAARKIVTSVVREIGGGYLRWKALRLGMKLFGMLVDTLTTEPGKENKHNKKG